MRHTSRAIIIKNKQLLLLTGHGADFYWTPGGGREEDETAEEALVREVKEELSMDVLEYSPYLFYEYGNQIVSSYIVDIEHDFAISNEITGYIWFKPGDDYKLSEGLEFKLLPQLLADGLL